MTQPIHTPRGYDEFKRQCQSNDRHAVMLLKWNDLSPQGKERIAISIKHYTHSYTVKNHPKATLENIILALTTINPTLDETVCYRSPRWAFSGSCMSTAHWLDRISKTIVFTLQLRKQNSNRFYNFYLACEGWGQAQIARDISAQDLRAEGERDPNDYGSSDPIIVSGDEIGLNDVEQATHLTNMRNNN